MKKLLLALILAFSTQLINAQNTYTEYPGRWRLGFNMGALWQTGNVTPYANIGGGFSIEKILYRKVPVIGFALGFRFMSGHCYGLDNKPSYAVANNLALNGTYDPAVNYTSQGIFYNNYKSFIKDYNLELKLNFPRFEQRTHLIFHLIGGVGVCNYKTWINSLDGNGNMYDFTSLAANPAVKAIDVEKFLNGSNNTLAQGSAAGGTYAFVPSLGAGLGFHMGKYVSLVFEYRASFPGTKLLDGYNYDRNGQPSSHNDFYNYACANLLFTIHGKSNSSSTTSTQTNSDVYTNGTNTVSAAPQQPSGQGNVQPAITPSQPSVTQPAVVQPAVTQGYPPQVTISYPYTNSSLTYDYATVQGSITNINQSNQITITQNGYSVRHFSYDAHNGNFHFNTFLQPNANTFVVTANNPFGQGTQAITVFYNPPPGVNGYTGGTATITTTNSETVTANTPINNTITATTFSTATQHNPHAVTTTTTPAAVAPSYTLTNPTAVPAATLTTIHTETSQAVGSHGQQQLGTVQIPQALYKKPVVQYTDPVISPLEVNQSSYIIKAAVTNVSAASQIKITADGNNVTNFNFNPADGSLSFPFSLTSGYNSITITATTAGGSDTKSTLIDYKQPAQPPKIVIYNPTTYPYSSYQKDVTVYGYVYNIQSSSQITVTNNGQPANFIFNASTYELEIPVHTDKASQVVITATNTAGSDTKKGTLLYIPTPANDDQGGQQGSSSSAGQQHFSKPSITVLSPSSLPYTTLTGAISISANVNFLSSASDASVTYNGNPVSFSFNPKVSEQLNFNSPLKPGMNTFIITATNQIGTTTQNIDINYVSTNTNSNVNGNPSIHFGGGFNNAMNNTAPPRGQAPVIQQQPANTPIRGNQQVTPVENSAPKGGGRPSNPQITPSETPSPQGRPVMRPR